MLPSGEVFVMYGSCYMLVTFENGERNEVILKANTVQISCHAQVHHLSLSLAYKLFLLLQLDL